MTATTSLRERLQKIRHNLLIARQHEGPIGLRSACDSAREELELIIEDLSTPPAGEWMPIADVPKDGKRKVVLYHPGHAADDEYPGHAEVVSNGKYAAANAAIDGYTHFTHLPASTPEPATQEVG